ncbi:MULTISPECIES: zf-HC2 domain-containing protein [unclassified Sporosarcina]|uniref:zf-HC2 domain-containing protein n=1 Tax=unclassified Sporosarcina TaxID=2647733 RepID=UPI00203E0C93|nr:MULTISPECIES: zf-HC2 domain-containing protein [unclassified Sporosarcina]GKV65393.1 anti-sigma-W factor RsiW [Sporosarcina sp. NCCP-2331]GLB55517.1 anti-sigma-W factor RsiW [Sporosarcina sp. NCCP-2378]
MKKCPKHVVHYMHALLDGEITNEEEKILTEHISTCDECRNMMEELEQTVNLFSSVETVQAPSGFVSGVTARLPQQNVKKGPKKWLRQHPMMAAAALFLILMSASFFSSFENEQQFSFTKQPNVVVEGETVVVPAGETVKGDLVVKNGDLRIEGEVDGNVTVIRGSKFMASTAVITGSSEEINEVFDWLWYKIKSVARDVIPSSKADKEQTE